MVNEVNIGQVLYYTGTMDIMYTFDRIFVDGDVIKVYKIYNDYTFSFTSDKYPGDIFQTTIIKSWSDISILRNGIINNILDE